MDEIEQQIAALQEKKNQLKISDTQDKLNNFCKNISEIPLSDIKTTIESKIKQELYDNCIKQQYGYWEKSDTIDFCDKSDRVNSWMIGLETKLDENLPKRLIYNLLDNSVIDKYNNEYEIKLYLKRGFDYQNEYIQVDNFDFIINDEVYDSYILLFKSLKSVIKSPFCLIFSIMQYIFIIFLVILVIQKNHTNYMNHKKNH